MNNEADEYMAWVRSRSSFREGYSRGSQTTTGDLEEFSVDRSRPIPPATNVRRASFLLGDLRAIYSSQQSRSLAPTLGPEIRAPPSRSNPFSIYYQRSVLPELNRELECRRVWEQKCRSFVDKRAKRTVAELFLVWRQSNLRQLNRDLQVSVEKNTTNFYRQRRASVVKVWSHIAIGLNQNETLQNRRGGVELASQTIGQRLARQNEGAADSITGQLIDDEIERMTQLGWDVWLSGYRKVTYFHRWRKSMALPLEYWKKRRCKSIISCWRAQSKAAIEFSGKSLTLDYSRYEEAKSYHCQRVIRVALRRWIRRRYLLLKLASLCLRMWQTTKVKQCESKRKALLEWTTVVRVNKTYLRQPFQSWREFAFNQKHRSRILQRLVVLYLHSKRRRRLGISFRLWKQQSRYSRVTALYTRNELASLWLQEKQRADSMKSKVESCSRLEMQIRRLEERLRRSEDARLDTEKQLLELKSAKNNASSPFRESLKTICPILMHRKNVL